MRLLLAAIFFACFLAPSPADADGMPSWGSRNAGAQQKRVVRSAKRVSHRKAARVAQRSARRGARVAARHTAGRGQAVQVQPVVVKTPFGTTTQTTVSRAGVPGEILQFLSRVQSQCGAVRIISSYRPGARIARSGRMSCHAMGQAVDYQVANPSCALQVARGFRGGHSTDYHNAPGGKHFHASLCEQEMGVRFAHRGGSRMVRRYASSRRYAGRSYAGKRYAQYRRR